jgi:fructoselysine-6-P-deglycase FrlB-like protein
VSRLYDDGSVPAILRSGTTADLVRWACKYAGTRKIIGVIGTPGTPLVSACDDVVPLAYAHEVSLPTASPWNWPAGPAATRTSRATSTGPSPEIAQRTATGPPALTSQQGT